MDAGTYKKLSPTLLFLVILAGVGIFYVLLPDSGEVNEERWLNECRTNLDEVIAEAQGARLAAGQGYLGCSKWPDEVPSTNVTWDRVERRCCASCRGTWESFCDFEVQQEASQDCWAGCVEERAKSDDPEVQGDWTNSCCSTCGGQRTVRCTVADDEQASEKNACIRKCEIEDDLEKPPSCWWDLGFEPGVGMRGQYEVKSRIGTSAFEATCRIRRKSGEIVEFETVGRAATSN